MKGGSFSPSHLPLFKHWNWLWRSQSTRTSNSPTKTPLLKTTPNPHSRFSSWIPASPSLRADLYPAEFPREPSAEGSGRTAVRSCRRAPSANTGFGSEVRRLLPGRAVRSERGGQRHSPPPVPGLGAQPPPKPGLPEVGLQRGCPSPAGTAPSRAPLWHTDRHPLGGAHSLIPTSIPIPPVRHAGAAPQPHLARLGRNTRKPLRTLRWHGWAGTAEDTRDATGAPRCSAPRSAGAAASPTPSFKVPPRSPAAAFNPPLARPRPHPAPGGNPGRGPAPIPAAVPRGGGCARRGFQGEQERAKIKGGKGLCPPRGSCPPRRGWFGVVGGDPEGKGDQGKSRYVGFFFRGSAYLFKITAVVPS